MISPILFVFLLQLLIHVVNSIGSEAITDVLWLLYTKLPTSQSKQAASLSDLRAEVVRLNREMTATSAQDEFSKWAKLRRQHDKKKEEYDEKARAEQSFRTTFSRLTTALRFLGTQGLNFGANMYFSKQPMFWLPQGWVPYHVEWILSCPRAPLGSVSINVWGIACASVIHTMSECFGALRTLRSGEVKEGVKKGEKIRLEKPVAVGGGAREKKEL